MAKYRKLPVVIEAVQFIDEPKDLEELSDFMQGKPIVVSYAIPEKPTTIISTLEGEMTATVGDYIIQGVNGEFYPIKNNIFHKTYELAEESLEEGDGMQNNGLTTCLHCGVEITEENDSGWEAFATAHTTQKTCKACTVAVHGPILRAEGEPCTCGLHEKCNMCIEVEMKTIVIAGFPGVGKTYFAKYSGHDVLDSDSSSYSWLTDTNLAQIINPEFPKNYIDHIKENIGKVEFLLVSTHKLVRDALVEEGIPFTLVYPDRSLENEYIRRFKDRDSTEGFINLMHTNWNGFITECEQQERCSGVIMEAGAFLGDVIDDVRMVAG